MYFDPRNPYSRRMWHYESDRPLSIAQLVALGSLDARTAALLWLLIERHQSLIVSGPTDPTAGAGKTTTLNALLGFLPGGSTLVYTTGMYEEFDWLEQVEPPTTRVLANEVSNHLVIYMWGKIARRFLRLPERGYAIATSCHADTIEDVVSMLARDLKLPATDISRLGVVVNIGFVGRLWPPRRRFLTVNFLRPQPAPAPDAATTDDPAVKAAARYASVNLLPLATWNEDDDTFTPADDATLADLASILAIPPADLHTTLDRRATLIAQLAEGRGVGLRAMREAIDAFTTAESGQTLAAPRLHTPPDTDDNLDRKGL